VDLAFRLPAPGEARVSFYDAEGRRVGGLPPADRPAGVWRVRWEGRDKSGGALPAGVYFAVIEFAGERRAARIVLTR
jgi:hypothetical protein